ncbi:hypothetical protein DAVIS_02096 [Mycobacterium marinum]|uniref:Uncharacterized protein n=1 Tax=Mycobacterium marinum TaxID=1781 RepID=A0A3E2MXH7_MYCMR|nr:hypothetical protein DAVIS_02096 [Mycobacterium marinum]
MRPPGPTGNEYSTADNIISHHNGRLIRRNAQTNDFSRSYQSSREGKRRWKHRVPGVAGRCGQWWSWSKNMLDRCRLAWWFQSPAPLRTLSWRRASGAGFDLAVQRDALVAAGWGVRSRSGEGCEFAGVGEAGSVVTHLSQHPGTGLVRRAGQAGDDLGAGRCLRWAIISVGGIGLGPDAACHVRPRQRVDRGHQRGRSRSAGPPAGRGRCRSLPGWAERRYCQPRPAAQTSAGHHTTVVADNSGIVMLDYCIPESKPKASSAYRLMMSPLPAGLRGALVAGLSGRSSHQPSETPQDLVLSKSQGWRTTLGTSTLRRARATASPPQQGCRRACRLSEDVDRRNRHASSGGRPRREQIPRPDDQ